MKISADELLEKLEQSKEYKLQFNCLVQVGDIKVNVARHEDVVGNIMQEWVEGWLKKNGIEYASNLNSLMPLSVYLDPTDTTHNLLAIKAFNLNTQPGFDIADFKAYIREIVDKPYMLHCQYIIFGYKMSDDGVVTIKDLWLKNVWEIPHSTRASKYPIFASLEHYLSAIEETMYNYPGTREQDAVGWKQKMEKSYKAFYGKDIHIPRWMDIEKEYRL